MPSVELGRAEFARRYRQQFFDPLFDAVSDEIDVIGAVAWRSYSDYHKARRPDEELEALRRK